MGNFLTTSKKIETQYCPCKYNILEIRFVFGDEFDQTMCEKCVCCIPAITEPFSMEFLPLETEVESHEKCVAIIKEYIDTKLDKPSLFLEMHRIYIYPSYLGIIKSWNLFHIILDERRFKTNHHSFFTIPVSPIEI